VVFWVIHSVIREPFGMVLGRKEVSGPQSGRGMVDCWSCSFVLDIVQ